MSKYLQDDLRNAVREDRLIAVVGSGISIAATESASAASWLGLIQDGARRGRDLNLIDPATEAEISRSATRDVDAALAAAFQIGSKLKQAGEFERWMEESVGQLRIRNHRILGAILNLGVPILTTNYDTLLASAGSRSRVTWQRLPDVEKVLARKSDDIVHLHGAWDEPDSVILGPDDYARASNDIAHILNMFRPAHSLLFVGCGDGLTDPSFSRFFEWLRKHYSGSLIRSFLLTTDDDVASTRDRYKSDGIHVLGYGGRHEDLAPFLESIHPLSSPSLRVPAPPTPADPPSEPASAKVYRREAEIGKENYDRFYEEASNNIDLMGHGLFGLFSGHPASVQSALARGCRVRVLILDPNSYQVTETAERLKSGETPLRDKIEATLRNITTLQAASRTLKGQLEIRLTRRVMYCKICRFDDRMVVTPYSSKEEPGANSPSFLSAQGETLFDFYREEFDRMWRHHSVEYWNGRVLDALPAVGSLHERYGDWKSLRTKLAAGSRDEGQPPVPQMMIVYPTYRCNLNCDFCTTGEALQSGSDMPVEIFRRILGKAAEFGVRNVELSGGGEPLHHRKIDELLKAVRVQREATPEMRFGLLSNGLEINAERAKLLASEFAYVRLTFNELTARNDVWRRKFLSAVDTLCKERDEIAAEVRVGVKLVLTTKLVEDEIESGFIRGMIAALKPYSIQHVRVKVARSPNETPAEDRLATAWPGILTAVETTFRRAELLADSSSVIVGPSYRCWFGASAVVVDPEGGVHPCLNYHNVDQGTSIGNLGVSSFADIWKASHIRKVLQDCSVRACNHSKSVDCRMAKYQYMLEEQMDGEQFHSTINPAAGSPITSL